MRMPHARVIAVAVRDDRALHRPPGIDIEIAGRAVQSFGTGNDQVQASFLYVLIKT